MKILMAHNEYQLAGGEDTVFRAEVDMLRARGHEVREYVKSNEALQSMGRVEQLRTTIWNPKTIIELQAIFRQEKFDIAHFHNTLAVISPSAYKACVDAGVPVVQTLHNYRQLCPNALFYRDGHACEDCLGKNFPTPGVIHGCYRGSRSTTLGIALMLSKNRSVTLDSVSRFICLTEFAKEKHVVGGIPAEKIMVKPNFLSNDPGIGGGGNYSLFVGRLSSEKGPDVLVRAWALSKTNHTLKIVGDGPMMSELVELTKTCENIEFLGKQPPEKVRELQKNAAVCIISSRVYEGLPMTLVESFACGTPVIAPHHAALPELVGDGGWTYLPEDVGSLAELIQGLDREPDRLERARIRAREIFEARFTADQNYAMLMAVYDAARSGELA